MSAAAPAAARAATDADAILGVRPREVFTPATVPEAAAVLGKLARDSASVGFIGGGTTLALGRRPMKLDAVVRTERLDRIVEHAPSDQIVIVEAGLTLSALQRAVAAHGQRLALDPPLADRRTVGGLVATNAFGPRRTRYGTLRDLVIGISLVRADGIVARGGGKVVKNVAGFDLPKMMIGSLGTLGLVASVTFRLHPRPEAGVTLVARSLGARGVRGLVAAMRDAQLEPSSVVALLEGGRFDVAVRFEGFPAGVAEQRDRLLALVARTPGDVCDTLPDADARAFEERHDVARTAGPLRVKAAMLPSAFEEFFERVFPTLRDAVSEAALTVYPTLGVSYFSGSASDADAAAAAITSARSSVAATGGSLVLEEAPDGVRALADPWGPLPSSFALMRSLKEQLDPASRLNPGRFVGGI